MLPSAHPIIRGGRTLTIVKLCKAICSRCMGPARQPDVYLLASEHMIGLKDLQTSYMLLAKCCTEEQSCVRNSWAYSPAIAQ